MISSPFAALLRAGRADFNTRFAAARLQYPALDGNAFSDFLLSCADPAISAAAQANPDRAPAAASAAYDAALELVGQGLAGPSARHPWINAGWRRVLPAAAPLVAAAPGQIIAAVSNALHHLATTPGARPDEWIATLERHAPDCKDPDTLLRFGKVAAWRAGLAHYRTSALALADSLPEPLALAAVRAPAHATAWPALRPQFDRDPWFDPAAPTRAALAVVRRTGDFRGFGGLFTEPPHVSSTGGQLLITAGPDAWWLIADAFGTTLHPATPSDAMPPPSPLPPDIRIDKSSVRRKDANLRLPDLGEPSSAAALSHTLALTFPLTHSVTLIALT